MQLAPGTRVTAELTLVRPLNEGAMGSVWIASHAGLATQVAVKFVAGHASRDAQMLARFEREVAAAAQLDNPNVVRIVEHGTTGDGTPYLAMELLEGETLAERIDRVGRLPLSLATHVLRCVGNALDAAHARGIIHRDIKPANVFLVGNDLPAVKVLDFGMAKQVRERGGGEVTATGVAVGTPEYMSPEQVLGSKEVDLRSDLWALGALIFRVLTGRTPFAGDTPHALFFNICKGAFPSLYDVGLPLELEPWFRRVFAPNKSKRFGSAREMVLRFEAIAREIGEIAVATDDESTQLFDVSRAFGTAELDPRTPVAGVSAVREEQNPARTHDLSALRLSNFELLDPEDDLPTFQLSPEQAERLHAEARARLADDASPLPLLKPSRASEASPDAAGAPAQPSQPGPPSSPARRRPLPSEPGAPAARGSLPSQPERPSQPSQPEARPGRLSQPEAPPSSQRTSVSDAEVAPLEVPGSLAPRAPQTALASLPPPPASNAWKVGLAAGALISGLAAAVVMQQNRSAAPTPQADPPAAWVAPPDARPSPAVPSSAAPNEAEPEAEPEAQSEARAPAVTPPRPTPAPVRRPPPAAPRPAPIPPQAAPTPPAPAPPVAPEPEVDPPAPEPAPAKTEPAPPASAAAEGEPPPAPEPVPQPAPTPAPPPSPAPEVDPPTF